MVNATDYGLANSVWTADLQRAARVAESMVAANSWINAHNLFPHGVPYGGVKKSGMGGGVLSIHTYLRLSAQHIGRPTAVKAPNNLVHDRSQLPADRRTTGIAHPRVPAAAGRCAHYPLVPA